MPKKRRRRRGSAGRVSGSRSGAWWTIGLVCAAVVAVGAIIWGVNSSPTGPRPAESFQPGEVQRIALDQARVLADRGEAVLFDVRSADRYQESHAKGAISLPESDVASLIGTLPQGKGLVLY